MKREELQWMSQWSEDEELFASFLVALAQVPVKILRYFRFLPLK